MKFLVASLAVFTLAGPTLAAALLNDPTIDNQIHHGGQTKVRMDAWGVAHPVAFDPQSILPVSINAGATSCPKLHNNAATFQTSPSKASPSLIAA